MFLCVLLRNSLWLCGDGLVQLFLDTLRLRRGRPGRSDFSPWVTGRRWFELHLRVYTGSWMASLQPVSMLILLVSSGRRDERPSPLRCYKIDLAVSPSASSRE